jgi:hypothetical protein
MSDVTKVGELIAPGSQRDAIHIAVAPVVAMERLEPGQTIGFASAGANWLNNNDYYCEGGTFEGETVPDEYWDHYQEITGRKVKSGERESFFTCSC